MRFKVNRALTNIVILLLILFFTESCNKSYTDLEEKLLEEKEAVIEKIELLHASALLIRLKTKENQINSLKSVNRDEEAKLIKEKIEIFNADLIESFREEYTFSEVYFFESNYSGALKNKDFEAVKLIDINRKEVKKIDVLEKGFLVGVVEPRAQFDMLIIKDKDFEEIKKPMPNKFVYSSLEEVKKRSKRLKRMKKWVRGINKRFKTYYKISRRERSMLEERKRKKRNYEDGIYQ